MDAHRFDTLTRSLTVAGSRRRALSALLGGTLVLLGPRSQDSAAHNALKKCKKKSGQQKKKCVKKAKQHNATHTTQAPPLLCAGRPDDAVCTGGKCLQGVCNPTPSCTGGGAPCPTQGQAQCCGSSCDEQANTCGRGPAGTVCIDGRDCTSGVCSGYRCVDTGCVFNNDYCIGGVGPCHNGGFCLQPLGAAELAARCGDNTGGSGCGCTNHQECVALLGAGAFCAQDTGPSCDCSGAPTFCVGPR